MLYVWAQLPEDCLQTISKGQTNFSVVQLVQSTSGLLVRKTWLFLEHVGAPASRTLKEKLDYVTWGTGTGQTCVSWKWHETTTWNPWLAVVCHQYVPMICACIPLCCPIAGEISIMLFFSKPTYSNVCLLFASIIFWCFCEKLDPNNLFVYYILYIYPKFPKAI